MTLIKTFQLRNKVEIDILINGDHFLTITRPLNLQQDNLEDNLEDKYCTHFDLIDGFAEMYPNPNKINSFIYYTSSGGNQMSIILNKNEADELLKLTYIECDSDSNYTDTDTNSTPTQSIELEDIFQPEWRKWPTDENFVEDNSKIKIITNIENENDLPLFFEYQELELLFKHPELYIQYEYLQVPIIDKWDHPIDNMTFVYTISINKGTSQITCVSEKYYKIGDLVNVDCYNKYFSINGINTNSIISEYISEYKGSKESEQLSNFFNWFKF